MITNEHVDTVIQTCRILFGIIGVLNTLYLIHAYDLNWAFQKPFGSSKILIGLLWLLIAGFTLLVFNIQTASVGLITFLLYLYLFHYSVFYGLENILIQIGLIYFTLSGYLSHTSSHLAENGLVIAIGITWLSASLNKWRDPIWKRGLGAYYFFLFPIWRRWKTRWITGSKRLSLFTNYATILLQMSGLIFFLFSPKLGVAVAAGLLLFSISLSSLFVMTWVGEVLSILSVIILVYFCNLQSSLVSLWWFEISTSFSFLHMLVLFTLFAAFWSACVVIWIERPSHPILKWFNITMRYVSRYTWGLSIVKVFTSLHIQGPVLFRMYLVFDDMVEKEVFASVNQFGFPTSWRNFKPTFVESISTKLTEVSMELDEYGMIKTYKRRQFLFAFCSFLRRTESEGKNIRWIRFDSFQLVPPQQFSGSDEWFREQSWKGAFHVVFYDQQPNSIEVIGHPILRAPSGRDLNRDGFNFSDNLKKSNY